MNNFTSHPSYNPNTGATSQVVSDAIDRSVSHNEIVHVDHHDAVVAELERECEGSAESMGTREFWGVDCDGRTWRVHVDPAN